MSKIILQNALSNAHSTSQGERVTNKNLTFYEFIKSHFSQNKKITNTNHIKNKNYSRHYALSSLSRKVEHFEVSQYKRRATTKLAQLMPIEKAINLAINFVKISTIEETLITNGTGEF